MNDSGKDGKPITLPVRHIVYTVVAEDGDRVRRELSRTGRMGGWKRANGFACPNGAGSFTKRIETDPKCVAWSRRGFANRLAGKADIGLKDLEEAVRLARRTPTSSEFAG